jgi:transposase-like protein
MPGQINRYSSAFKLKVVSEIESGKYTLAEAYRVYDITGHNTIQSWIRKYGKTQLLSKVVRIQMKDERDQVKELKKQIRTLERALAHERIHNICWKSLVEVIDEKYSIDSKKNFGSKLPQELRDVLEKLS